MHVYHDDLKGIVLFDGCHECESRVNAPLGKLWELDAGNLQTLADLATGIGTDGMSHADRAAIQNLRLMARIVFQSGISAEVAK